MGNAACCARFSLWSLKEEECGSDTYFQEKPDHLVVRTTDRWRELQDGVKTAISLPDWRVYARSLPFVFFDAPIKRKAACCARFSLWSLEEEGCGSDTYV